MKWATIILLCLMFKLCACEVSVSVTCTPDMMQLVLTFESKFNGRITVLPHKECEILGENKRLLLFPLSLQSSPTERCYLNKINNDYVGLVQIRNHKTLVLSNDATYLVKCPAHIIPPPSINNGFDGPSLHAQLYINPKGSKFEPSFEGIPLETVTGKSYTLTIVVNQGLEQRVRVGKCLLFANEDVENTVELTDMDIVLERMRDKHAFCEELPLDKRRFWMGFTDRV
ncbi:unnamed protein product [Bursaphelenchus okinawaensis]|uniref:ZP domain-containing protein n=1 Tax=Bursaphelenchus okinawaensis TaxID=465554 RepID=A0A811KXI3_9BILA|nr:unnamed protein product [Bursaphelenchus okinawaensis]CAG9113434.1 unnamed protein product [Bursaphelenchus okinawaensis]